MEHQRPLWGSNRGPSFSIAYCIHTSQTNLNKYKNNNNTGLAMLIQKDKNTELIKTAL